MEQFEAGGRRCTTWVPEGEGPWPAVYLCGGDLNGHMEELIQGNPRLLLCAVEGDWTRDYTPWPAPPLPDRDAFTGGGPAFLRVLTEEVVPFVEKRYSVQPAPAYRGLMGYSLGGLFSLWAMYQGTEFGIIGSLSGSLWYDGFMDYLRETAPPQGKRVYLSLGKAEEYGGGPQTWTVGEKTQEAYELLCKVPGPERVTLEWNRGGHFTGVPNRWRKALRWMEGQCNSVSLTKESGPPKGGPDFGPILP